MAKQDLKHNIKAVLDNENFADCHLLSPYQFQLGQRSLVATMVQTAYKSSLLLSLSFSPRISSLRRDADEVTKLDCCGCGGAGRPMTISYKISNLGSVSWSSLFKFVVATVFLHRFSFQSVVSSSLRFLSMIMTTVLLSVVVVVEKNNDRRCWFDHQFAKNCTWAGRLRRK